MNVRRFLLTALIVSFCLALFQVYVQEPYHQSIRDQGKEVGVGETAVGYFAVYLISAVVVFMLLGRQRQTT